MTVLDAAKALVKRGVSVVPTKEDKIPTIKWGHLQTKSMPLGDVERLFGHAVGVGIICGAVSGHLECIDFDDLDAYPKWRALLEDNGFEVLLTKLVVQRTKSGGRHVVYRCLDGVGGNMKLAERGDPREVMVETRGEGGYFVAYPSPGYTMEQGTWAKVPEVSGEERDAMLSAGRMLGETTTSPYSHKGPEDIKRPGDVYAGRNTWADVLEPHGWTFSHQRGDESYWVRPGKSKRDGLSATTNYRGADLLKVFSSNAHPLEPGATYTKFAAHAFLAHGGDMRAAAKALADAQGMKPKTPTWNNYDSGLVSELVKPAVAVKRKTLADFEPEEPKFLFDDWRYLRDEQVNLIDAKGGTGKTSLILCLGAMGSRGVSPGGMKVEPFTTLYYGSEDSGGELRASYDEHGGNPSKFVYVPDILAFDRDGIDVLHDDLEQTGAKVFVLDAAKYYLPGGKGMEFDAGIVADFMARMREAAREHHATCVLLRHFARNTKDRDLLDQGAGIEQWYSSCRSNLVSLKHPEKPGNAIVCHAKGSLRSRTLPPFGCGWKQGVWGFWTPKKEDLVHFGMDEDGTRIQIGRPPAKGEDAKQFLCDLLRDSEMKAQDIIDRAERAGIKRPTLYRAKAELNIDDRRGYWRLDPYAD